jgi:hypothetical protein
MENWREPNVVYADAKITVTKEDGGVRGCLYSKEKSSLTTDKSQVA